MSALATEDERSVLLRNYGELCFQQMNIIKDLKKLYPRDSIQQLVRIKELASLCEEQLTKVIKFNAPVEGEGVKESEVPQDAPIKKKQSWVGTEWFTPERLLRGGPSKHLTGFNVDGHRWIKGKNGAWCRVQKHRRSKMYRKCVEQNWTPEAHEIFNQYYEEHTD